jgi:hypothetical protein
MIYGLFKRMSLLMLYLLINHKAEIGKPLLLEKLVKI